MTVRQQAYLEMWAWLESDRSQDEPRPPEGMHQLAVREWWEGHGRAQADHDKEEAILDTLVNTTMKIIKYLILLALVGASYWLGRWLHNPYLMVGAGIAGLVYLWRTR